ncbi:MAG TPA: CaiB/BaiF CoA-transferase family protein [Parvularculaceae bacterium]|nr:CaiB/BaiF CoA-transferase family protein [Parvularculaceae bacterium]HNS85611.1 CaiB/BaiF CoA-transferase family protein [Parvularculaceae bacterium]
MTGTLAGLRIIEIAGIGPGPFCGMMLADHGAEVIRVDRLKGDPLSGGPLARSRKSIAVDIRKPEGAAIVRDLAKIADGLFEGNRPGVMERLGLGPDALLKDNPKLVYGRMTGWGQTGPLAPAAGHDINYISVAGALHGCGQADGPPTPPVNYLGDFGGGGMLLAFGMVSGLLAVKNGAPGQVIDCAMTDGSALLTTMIWGMRAQGFWRDDRGVNMLDTGAHFYNTFETKDGKWISIGSIEPQFYALLREKLGLQDRTEFDAQMNPAGWPALKEELRSVFKTKTRDEWCAWLEGTDVCFGPVLSMGEAPTHPHNLARKTFVNVGGVTQPAPAPRYSASLERAPTPPREIGADTDDVLSMLGRDAAAIKALKDTGIVR